MGRALLARRLGFFHRDFGTLDLRFELLDHLVDLFDAKGLDHLEKEKREDKRAVGIEAEKRFCIAEDSEKALQNQRRKCSVLLVQPLFEIDNKLIDDHLRLIIFQSPDVGDDSCGVFGKDGGEDGSNKLRIYQSQHVGHGSHIDEIFGEDDGLIEQGQGVSQRAGTASREDLQGLVFVLYLLKMHDVREVVDDIKGGDVFKTKMLGAA